MKINGKPVPQWVTLLIALILIVTINFVWKHLNRNESDKWKSLQTVTEKASINLIPNTAERRKWCNCIMATFKRKYPNGIGELSQDSLNVQMAGTSYDCIHAIRHQK